ncbi:unnamed protein product [Dibothriocephalus latus]|uniref:Uncharacterized protein n=1 Tax=Dibothriocephalus latus TaxID=60516 RepID=A0A3P7LM13_DIBLA|nr:unnamed protein product [Dibothriocephalus latus]
MFFQFFTHSSEHFRRDWHGLAFSNPFTYGYSEFCTLFDLSLLNFPNFAHHDGARFGLQRFSQSLELQQCITLDALKFSHVALHIVFATVLLRTEHGKPVDHASGEIGKVILNLDRLLHSLLQIHVDGKVRSDLDLNVSTTDILKTTDALFNPLILLEIERVTTVKMEEKPALEEEIDGWNFVPSLQSAWTTSLLSHLLSYKSLLEEQEGTDFSFLTLRHISHSLLELLMLGKHTLAVCLHTCLLVIAERPDWQARLLKEITTHVVECPHAEGSTETHLADECFEIEADCLPWAKALCLETLRFTVAGWPFDALFEATRDGQVCGYNYNAGDLLLLNEPRVFHDPGVWFGAAERPAAEVYDSISSICHPPRAFIYRLLLAALIEFFGMGWKVEVGGKLSRPENPKDPSCRFHALGCELPPLTLLRPSL